MASREEAIEKAASLMTDFADRTGLSSDGPGRRYLWTDAFAVCNFLGLARATGEERFTALALRLVDRVHHALGRHRADDSRSGWISGLGDQEGELHPTRGGLRIGKTLPERPPGEPFDERREWDRDGQYFHYLTKWMHALDQVSSATRNPRFNLWARELALAAHASFPYGPRGPGRRMAWKMSTDLSRPLVPSMGQHDPLDGFVTCLQLETTAALLSRTPAGPGLEECAADFATMTRPRDLGTADPLGLGGLLMDACRCVQLERHGAFTGGADLLEALLEGALDGLRRYSQQGDPGQPASRRLAFRELGLAIGLSAVGIMQGVRAEGTRFAGRSVHGRLDGLASYVDLGRAIESFWLDPEHRRNRTWSEHRDIDEVMLATSLVPEGCLVILPAP